MAIKEQIHYAAELHRARRDDESLSVLRTIVQQDHSQISAWWAIAAISRNWDERYYALNEVLRLNPTHEKARTLRAKLFPQSSPAVTDDTLPPWIAPSEHETELIPAWISRAAATPSATLRPPELPEFAAAPPPMRSDPDPHFVPPNPYYGPPNVPNVGTPSPAYYVPPNNWNVGVPPVAAAPWNAPNPYYGPPSALNVNAPLAANPRFRIVQRRARFLSLLGFIAVAIALFVPFGNFGFYVPLYNGFGAHVDTGYFSKDLSLLESYGAISYGDNIPVGAQGNAWEMTYWLFYDDLQNRGAYVAAALYILPLLLTLLLPNRPYHYYRRLQALYAIIEGAGLIYMVQDDEFEPLVGSAVLAVALGLWLIAGLLRVPRSSPAVS